MENNVQNAPLTWC